MQIFNQNVASQQFIKMKRNFIIFLRLEIYEAVVDIFLQSGSYVC